MNYFTGRQLFSAVQAVFSICFFAVGILGHALESDDVLKDLHSSHPRISSTKVDFEIVKKNIETEESLRRWRQNIEKRANLVMNEPPVQRMLVGPRLLAQSRQALNRISLPAGLYRLDNDRRKAERAKKERLAAAASNSLFEMVNKTHVGKELLIGTSLVIRESTSRLTKK